MSGGKSKAKGTARSQASIEHGAANGPAQSKDNLDQVRALAAQREQNLYAISPTQAIAHEVKLQSQVEGAKEREAEEVAIQPLDLAFNFSPGGDEISDAEDKRRVREEEKVQFYWAPRGASRSDKWKSVPLGGQYDNQGRSSECPVWYLASNMTQWDTWAVIDGTRAGLNGKKFLIEVMTRHAAWFADFTKHRLVVGQCHKKPHNIHAQHWVSVIGEAIPDPGKKDAQLDPQRPTGLLLGRADMKGRGKSPMRFSFLGKTGCSLENLRRAGYDICALTGDPHMVEKLDAWIARRKRNGRPVLDMESEKKLEEIVAAVRAEHPEWEPYFQAARERHRAQQEELIRLIHEQITRRLPNYDNYDLRARVDSEEAKHDSADNVEKPESGSQRDQPNAPAQHNTAPAGVADRSRIAAMGDALRRTLSGIPPTHADLSFIVPAPRSIGGYSLGPECWEQLGEALSEPSLRDVAQITRVFAAATEFTEFAAVEEALEAGDYSNPDYFERDGNLTRAVTRAAKAAANLSILTDHPLYCPAWADWGHVALKILDLAGPGLARSRDQNDIDN